MKISDTTGPRTSNYRIRKLADGRIGQQRKEQPIYLKPMDKEIPEGPGGDDPGVGDGGNDVSQNINTANNPRETPKEVPRRKSAPDTWAVCTSHYM